MGLRLAEGIDPRRFAAIAGRGVDPERIAALRQHGLIDIDGSGRLRVTPEGFPCSTRSSPISRREEVPP